VPLLALEGAGPLEAAKESVHPIKSKWGEGITGLVGIGAWTVFVRFVLGMAFAALGVWSLAMGDYATGALHLAFSAFWLLTVSWDRGSAVLGGRQDGI
jgi:Family of unknown function (DUF6159)